MFVEGGEGRGGGANQGLNFCIVKKYRKRNRINFAGKNTESAKLFFNEQKINLRFMSH